MDDKPSSYGIDVKGKDKDFFYEDMKEFLAKFIFTPNFTEYDHITKDMGVTNLRSRYSEPEMVRALLEAFHILINKDYYFEHKVVSLTGYNEYEVYRVTCKGCEGVEFVSKEAQKCGFCGFSLEKGDIVPGIINKPLYKEIVVQKSKFPRTHHYLLSKFVSLISTSQARDGHLIKNFNTKRLEREESIEDKTTSPMGFSPFGAKKKSVGGG